MPFRVVHKFSKSDKGTVYRAAVSERDDPERTYSLYNPFGLIWIREESMVARGGLLVFVDHNGALDRGCGAITVWEAEGVTNLHRPVCWDKILDEL